MHAPAAQAPAEDRRAGWSSMGSHQSPRAYCASTDFSMKAPQTTQQDTLSLVQKCHLYTFCWSSGSKLSTNKWQKSGHRKLYNATYRPDVTTTRWPGALAGQCAASHTPSWAESMLYPRSKEDTARVSRWIIYMCTHPCLRVHIHVLKGKYF